MIFRILYNGIDLLEDGLDNLVLNPSIEMELNTAGSCTFTLPPTHPMWGEVQVFSGDVEVYENGELIFFGRIINIDKNWNNERICECEGALAFLNDTYYDGHYIWKEDETHPGGWTIADFFRDVLNHHNLFAPTNRKIYPGNVDQYLESYIVTREVEWEKTLDILSKMCIDTNGGWFFLRKDPEDNKIYLDWKLSLTDSADQPVQFGLNLLDISIGYHGEDIVTGVIARGKQLDGGEYLTLAEYPDVEEEHGVKHTLGEKVLYFVDSYNVHGSVLQVHDFSDAEDETELFTEAKNWLIKKNTDVASIEVTSAELGYFGDSMYPIFRVGELVNVYDDIHFIETQTTTYPMYKISMDLNTGKKKITIGTPPKKELTQIYATDTDSTGNSGTKAGTSSGSGGGGSSSSDGVTDVRMNGSSVVNNHVASFSAVTTNQMNAAINRATENLTTKEYVDGRVVGNPTGTATSDLTKLKIGTDIFGVAAEPDSLTQQQLNTLLSLLD